MTTIMQESFPLHEARLYESKDYAENVTFTADFFPPKAGKAGFRYLRIVLCFLKGRKNRNAYSLPYKKQKTEPLIKGFGFLCCFILPYFIWNEKNVTAK